MSNIFVPCNLTEYEYQIYSFFVTWANMNNEYTFEQKIKYSYSNIYYSVPNIRIYSSYTGETDIQPRMDILPFNLGQIFCHPA